MDESSTSWTCPLGFADSWPPIPQACDPNGRLTDCESSTCAGPIVSRPWDRSGGEVVLWSGNAPLSDVSVGPNGSYWAFRLRTGQNTDILMAPFDSLDAMRPAVATAATETMPSVSPNGRLLAYQSDESGREEVYVQPLPGPGARVRVSVGGGEEPVWSATGSTLFYRGPARMMAATIEEHPELTVSSRDSLFMDRYARSTSFQNYDVFRDDRKFLMVSAGVSLPEREITVVINWLQRVRNSRH